MADNSTKIAALEQIINAAAQSTRVGETSVAHDLDFALKRLSALRAEDDASLSAGKFRPRTARINLSGF